MQFIHREVYNKYRVFLSNSSHLVQDISPPIYTYLNILHPITICQPNFVRNTGAEDKGLFTLVVNALYGFCLYRTVYNFSG